MLRSNLSEELHLAAVRRVIECQHHNGHMYFLTAGKISINNSPTPNKSKNECERASLTNEKFLFAYYNTKGAGRGGGG
jgi:hypothetical protein